MSLKIRFPRSVLEQMIREELASHIGRQLNEAPPGRGTALDDELPNPENAPEEQLPTTSPAPEAGDDIGEPEDLPTGDEPADDDLEADVAGDEDAGDEGTVAGEIAGKTIESVAIDDDSKIMPGSTEVIFTFRETPDALRLLVTKTGKVKVFFRGLHNDLGAAVDPEVGDDTVDDLGLGDEELPGEEPAGMGGEELEDLPPLGDEDMPPPPPEDEEEFGPEAK